MDATVVVAAVGLGTTLAATLGGVWLGNRNAVNIEEKRRADAREERAARDQASAEERHRQLRTASRLLVRELEHAQGAFTFAVEERKWWWEELPLDAWNIYGPLLAGAMTIEECDLVRTAYDQITSAERQRRTGTDLRAVPNRGRALIDSSAAVTAAVFALNRYAKVEVPSLLRPDPVTDHPGYGAALAALSFLGQPAFPQNPSGETSPPEDDDGEEDRGPHGD